MAEKTDNIQLPDTTDRELRKAHEAVAVRPTSGEPLTLLARKLYNIMLQQAQEQGVEKKRYRTPLKEVTSIAEFDSNDTAIIKRYLRQMNSTQVEWYSTTEGKRSWEVTNLISGAALEEVGGRVYMCWSYDESIKTQLLSPEMYARISLQLQNEFRSLMSLSLYEIGLRYADNPGGVTMRKPWEWWRPVLTGTPDSQATTYLEYKYFKRDVLKPALLDVNRISDITMKLIEHKAGRKVIDLQFEVERKAQAGLALEDRNIIDVSLLSRLMALGITQKEAEVIYTKTEESILRAAVTNTETRMKRSPPLVSPAAYLKDALKKGYIKPVKEEIATGKSKALAQPGKRSREQLIEAFNLKRSSDAEAMFGEMGRDQQDELLADWVSSVPATIRKGYDKSGLASTPARVSFNGWLANRTWGEPTAEDLLDFAMQQ